MLRRLAPAAVAACLAAGMANAGPAAAASTDDHAKAAGSSPRVSARHLDRRVRSSQRQVASARRSLRRLTRDLGALGARLGGAERNVGGLLAAAPQIVSSLGTLGTVVRNDLAPGLQRLGDTVQRDIAPALKTLGDTVQGTLVPGLTRTADAVAAQEYGVTKVFLGPGGAGGPLPIYLTTGDIPDDGNSAAASGQLPLSSGAGAGMIPEGTLLTARSIIRSAERDGEATGDPDGYAGGLMMLTCIGGAGPNGACDTDPAGDHGDTPAALRPAGAVVCVVGPPPVQNVPIPGGAIPYDMVKLQEGATRTNFNAPDAGDVSPLAGASAAAGSIVGPLADDAADGCRLGETGDAYMLTMQVQFADPPTSRTPDPKD